MNPASVSAAWDSVSSQAKIAAEVTMNSTEAVVSIVSMVALTSIPRVIVR